uniref:Penicillin-binding protein activator LpoA n=1 Tax=Lygus hesperus TaxID=30085 RepID=A0A0A9W5D9_LYGHE
MPAHSESDGKTVSTTGENISTNVTAIPSQVVTECGELPVPSASNTTMEANVTPSQAGVESGQTPVSSTDDRITTTTDVIPSQAAAESSQIPVSSTDNGTTTKTDVISPQAVDESGLIPVSRTDNGKTLITDVIPSQAEAESDEVPLSNNTNAGASMEVIAEGASEDHPKLDQIGEGSSVTQSDVPHGKLVSQMSPDERVAMRKLIAEKTREFRITGKKFCEERKLPFPNRQAFSKLIFDLYNTQKLDEHNLELKLMHKAQLIRDSSKKGDGGSALEGDEDGNVDLDEPMGDCGNNDNTKINTSKIGEFRDMAKTYCESKEIPFPNRRNFARIFRDLKSKKKLDEEHLKIALDENALKEKEKPTSEMTEDERTAFFNELNTLKAKMIHVAVQHCHTIKAPFPKRDYHRIIRDLFEAGKLNEDNIKLAIEKNFEEQCKNGPSLTHDQLNTILEHYCKDKGIRNTTKRIKDEMINKIPQKLLSLKHYWRLMHDAGKTNLFWDVNLNPDAANHSSSPRPALSEARSSRRKRGKRGRKHSRSRGGLEAVPQVADSTVPPERTQKRGLSKQTVGNGDLREVLTSKKRREAPSSGGYEGVDEEPIHELLAQIAEKTRLLEGLRAQNYNYSLGSGNGRPSRDNDFGHSYPADRRDWRSQDDVRFNPSMRSDRLRQNRDGGEPFMKYFRYDNRPFGESLDVVNQPIDWAADYENVAGPSNPGSSSRIWGRASPPVSHGQLISMDQEDQPFIEPGKICKVAIVDEAYPRRLINAQDANLIREALFNRIGSSGVGVGPRFSNTYEEQGAVVFDCEDQTTVAWLWTNAPVIKPWRDARLKPISWKRRSKEISIEIPKMLESHHSEAICERLDKQNPGLSTKLWNLKFADSTSRGLTLGFEIDDESMECLKSLNLQPFLGFSRVNVQVIRE